MGFRRQVRHPRAPPSKASRQPAGLPRPLCGLSEACLFSSPTGPARKRFCRPQLGPQSFFYGLPKATLDTHGPRPQRLLGGRQACPGLSVACPKPASSLHPRAPARTWASAGNVRHPLAAHSFTAAFAGESRCYSWSFSISSCRACSPELASFLSGIVFLKVCCVWPECAQRAALTRPQCGTRGTFADAGVSAR